MSIGKINRTKVYNMYNGNCAYCGNEIKSIKDMQIDHIVPKRDGGLDEYGNFNPSCIRCNHYKRGNSLATFREYLTTIHDRLAKYYLFKVAFDFRVVDIKPFDGVFHFEKCEKGGFIDDK